MLAHLTDRLRIRLVGRREFWVTRHRIHRLRNGYFRVRLHVAQRYETAKTSVAVAVRLLGQSASALVIAGLVLWLTQRLPSVAAGFHWSPLPDSWELWLISPVSGGYETLVAAGVGVAGTLLALYFATLGIIVSTTYARAARTLRALFMRLPAGRVFTFWNLLALIAGLMVLAMPLFNIAPTRPTILALVFLDAFVAVSLVRLGTQLFDFLEPTYLLTLVAEDATRAINEACAVAHSSSPGSRMKGARRRLAVSLGQATAVADLVREHQSKAGSRAGEYGGGEARTIQVAQFLVRLWGLYAAAKPRLPIASGWYSARLQHQDWLRSSPTDLGIAVATHTLLMAKPVPDELWVERRLVRALRLLLSNQESHELSAVLEALPNLTRNLNGRGMFAESRLWTELLFSLNQWKTTSQREEDVEGSRALAEVVGFSQVNSVLGLGDYARRLHKDFPSWIADDVRLGRETIVGSRARMTITNLRDAIAFEQSVEGRLITPDQVLHQLVSRDLASEVVDETSGIMASLEQDFWPWAKEAASSEPLSASIALSRLDEAIHKFETSLPDIENVLRSCESVHRDHDDGWPDLDLQSIRQRLINLRQQLRVPIAELAAKLPSAYLVDQPDYFGWAYTRAIEDSLEVLIDGNGELDTVLPHLLVASIEAHRRLIQASKRQHVSVQLTVSLEPYMTLCQLSGIALVLASIDLDSGKVAPFQRLWSHLLDEDAQRVMDIVEAAIAADEYVIGLTTGKVERARRAQQLEHVLRERGLTEGRLGRTDPEGVTEVAGRLIRQVMHSSPELVFVANYLVPEAQVRSASMGTVPNSLRILLDKDNWGDANAT